MTKKQYFLEGLPVTIRHHPRARSLKLRVDPLKKMPILTVPPRCASSQIENFLQSSVNWWKNHVENQESTALPSSIPFLGTPYRLIQKPALKMIEVDHGTQEILIGRARTDTQNLIKTHLMEQSFPYFETASQTYAQHLNVNYSEISLKEFRARWGVCRHDARIAYSWRLIMAPHEVLQYVCAHEVAHLRHFNHSPEFWATVATLMPDYKLHKTWLRKNGRTLFEAV